MIIKKGKKGESQTEMSLRRLHNTIQSVQKTLKHSQIGSLHLQFKYTSQIPFHSSFPHSYALYQIPQVLFN